MTSMPAVEDRASFHPCRTADAPDMDAPAKDPEEEVYRLYKRIRPPRFCVSDWLAKIMK
jgi:hypothetical protein